MELRNGDVNKMLEEVLNLQRVASPYVVRYVSCWIEGPFAHLNTHGRRGGSFDRITT
jgi:hypothetical protein